jgi:hypothetical protein
MDALEALTDAGERLWHLLCHADVCRGMTSRGIHRPIRRRAPGSSDGPGGLIIFSSFLVLPGPAVSLSYKLPFTPYQEQRCFTMLRLYDRQAIPHPVPRFFSPVPHFSPDGIYNTVALSTASA